MQSGRLSSLLSCPLVPGLSRHQVVPRKEQTEGGKKKRRNRVFPFLWREPGEFRELSGTDCSPMPGEHDESGTSV